MGEPIAVLALRRKRDQISGTIAHYERLLREAEHDLAHINASLRLFEATGEAADLPPYVDLNRVLRRDETTKICMDALVKEGPLDTRQLALRVMKAKGLSESDKVLAQTLALRVVQTLRMRARRGKVGSVTRTKGMRMADTGWAVEANRKIEITLTVTLCRRMNESMEFLPNHPRGAFILWLRSSAGGPGHRHG